MIENTKRQLEMRKAQLGIVTPGVPTGYVRTFFFCETETAQTLHAMYIDVSQNLFRVSTQ